jgi:hypothetical protein
MAYLPRVLANVLIAFLAYKEVVRIFFPSPAREFKGLLIFMRSHRSASKIMRPGLACFVGLETRQDTSTHICVGARLFRSVVPVLSV